MNKFFLFLASFLALGYLHAQEETEPDDENIVRGTFADRRVINVQSVEVLSKRELDFRVAHRFGDFAGASGGWQNFIGLENAADVQIGFEYGLTKNMTLGLSRTKGGSSLRQLVHGFGKYRFLQQTVDNKIPVSLTGVALATVSTMKASSDTLSISHFPKAAHRWMYTFELHIARKFEHFSMQLSPILLWRNYVLNTDKNALFSLNFAAKARLTRFMNLIVDVNFPFDKKFYTADSGYFLPIAAGLEFQTGGHVFQINFTNSTGIMPTDYLATTTSNWLKGEFRLGFTISRSWWF